MSPCPVGTGSLTLRTDTSFTPPLRRDRSFYLSIYLLFSDRKRTVCDLSSKYYHPQSGWKKVLVGGGEQESAVEKKGQLEELRIGTRDGGHCALPLGFGPIASICKPRDCSLVVLNNYLKQRLVPVKHQMATLRLPSNLPSAVSRIVSSTCSSLRRGCDNASYFMWWIHTRGFSLWGCGVWSSHCVAATCLQFFFLFLLGFYVDLMVSRVRRNTGSARKFVADVVVWAAIRACYRCCEACVCYYSRSVTRFSLPLRKW